MKKNLLSILILALLIVNIVLTSIMMFSATSANKKTAALVDDIATVLQLETGTSADGEAAVTEVAMADTEIYDIADTMTIPLKRGSDGRDHFVMVGVSLSLNTKDEGYKTYGADVASKESLIKSEVIDVFSHYTVEEAQDSTDEIKSEILTRIQNMYDSTFIFAVSFSSLVYQ